MQEDPIRYWVAIAAAALYVYQRSKDHPLPHRATQTAVSAAMGFALTPDLVALSPFPANIVGVAVVVLSYIVLDFVSSILGDRKLVLEILRRFLGK